MTLHKITHSKNHSQTYTKTVNDNNQHTTTAMQRELPDLVEIVSSKILKPSQIVHEETQISLSSLHTHNSPSASLFISFFCFHSFLFFLLLFQNFSFIISPPFKLLNSFSPTISFFSLFLLPIPFFVLFLLLFFLLRIAFCGKVTSYVLTSLFCTPQKSFIFLSLPQPSLEDTWHCT